MSVHHQKRLALRSETTKGFTLIELLVVISIIAILSAIGLVAFSNVLKGSRDAKRQSDLKFIQSALEEYHADQIYYPSSLSVLTTGRVYMTEVPTDPKPPPDYSYVPSDCTGTACTGYCLSAQLERVDPIDECTPASGHNYGVTRP